MLENGNEIREHLFSQTKEKPVPKVFFNGNYIGGYSEKTRTRNLN